MGDPLFSTDDVERSELRRSHRTLSRLELLRERVVRELQSHGAVEIRVGSPSMVGYTTTQILRLTTPVGELAADVPFVVESRKVADGIARFGFNDPQRTIRVLGDEVSIHGRWKLPIHDEQGFSAWRDSLRRLMAVTDPPPTSFRFEVVEKASGKVMLNHQRQEDAAIWLKEVLDASEEERALLYDYSFGRDDYEIRQMTDFDAEHVDGFDVLFDLWERQGEF